MKYYTSDLHLSHKNIIKYENRPFQNVDEMDDYMICKWNNKVGKGDEVYILGDFAFCSGRKANELLRKLNGQKFLIKGNHDSFLKDKDFDRSLFAWIRDYTLLKDEGRKVALFHYPIAVWDCKHHDSYHCYGHIHSDKESHHPLCVDLGKNAFNVGVDVRDFEPKTLDELIRCA